MEIYTIGLSNGWCISHENIDDFGECETPKIIDELNFGQLEVKDGKIMWIFDPFPIQDEVIEKCQNLAMFENTAEFRVSEFDGKKWVFKEAFKGSFIEYLDKKIELKSGESYECEIPINTEFTLYSVNKNGLGYKSESVRVTMVEVDKNFIHKDEIEENYVKKSDFEALLSEFEALKDELNEFTTRLEILENGV